MTFDVTNIEEKLVTPGLIRGSVATILIALITTYVGVRVEAQQTRDAVEALDRKLEYVITSMKNDESRERGFLQQQINDLKISKPISAK